MLSLVPCVTAKVTSYVRNSKRGKILVFQKNETHLNREKRDFNWLFRWIWRRKIPATSFIARIHKTQCSTFFFAAVPPKKSHSFSEQSKVLGKLEKKQMIVESLLESKNIFSRFFLFVLYLLRKYINTVQCD